MKYVPPSPTLTAFNCPHCGVLTTQWWYLLGAQSRPSEHKTPPIWKKDAVDKLRKERDKNQITDELLDTLDRLASGEPFFDGTGPTTRFDVNNIAVSRCMECAQLSVWVYDRLVWPIIQTTAPDPNPDLAAEILEDYREAATVLSISPRGAAALLRLCVQKLCRQLGETGENLNNDIAALVAKGLDARVQMALDVVRVIGNEAVHPGQIDLRDDRSTAEELFRLVNIVADIMISQPKRIGEIYQNLPHDKLTAIEQRNQRAIGAPKPKAED